MRSATLAVVVAWCLLAGADAGSAAGYYSSVALAAVVLGFVLVAIAAGSGGALHDLSRPTAGLAIGVCLAFAVDDATRPFLYVHGDRLFAIESLEVATALAASLLVVAGERHQRWLWWVVATLATATGIVVITLIRDPGIDVWDLLQQSSSGLLHGDDMYRQHWSHSTGLQAVYPYLPLSTVVLAPFRWLFGDVRFGLLAAILLSSWLVRRSSHSDGAILSCLLLVTPGWELLVNRSWTEPMLVLFVGGAILAIRAGRTTLAVLALAAGLASKQPVVLLLPVFAMWPAFGLRRAVTSAGLALAAIAPWLIAGPGDFWHDAVHANVSLGVRRSALDVPAYLLRNGHHIGFGLLAALVLATYLLCWFRVRRTPSGLALSCALVMWAYDVANKQTYFNHYQLPLGLLVVALATAGPKPGSAQTEACSGREVRRGSTGAERPVPD
jgi:hypothetical protein